jgi:hypothetical protein
MIVGLPPHRVTPFQVLLIIRRPLRGGHRKMSAFKGRIREYLATDGAGGNYPAMTPGTPLVRHCAEGCPTPATAENES